LQITRDTVATVRPAFLAIASSLIFRRSNWYFIQQPSGGIGLSNDLDRAIIKTLLSRIAGIARYCRKPDRSRPLQFFSIGLASSYRYIIIVGFFLICQVFLGKFL
jgi:hypothetical protein